MICLVILEGFQTGVYTLCPETWWSYTGKAIVGFLPFGTGITWLFESSENVVGGNSSTSTKQVFKDAIQEIGAIVLEKISEKLSGVLSVLSTLWQAVEVIEESDIVQIEKIAFDLLKRIIFH